MPKRRIGARPSRRRNRHRRELPLVVVVCDDSQAAGRYFKALQAEVKNSASVRVFPFPNESPEQMCQLARSKAGNQKEDSAWVLIDREARPETQQRADEAKRRLDRKKCRVLLSNPCFEVWTLAHLEDTGKHFDDCNAVLARLKQRWQQRFGEEFQKAKADYDKLMDFRAEAVVRAKRHCGHNQRTDCSWTEVYRVVEAVAVS